LDVFRNEKPLQLRVSPGEWAEPAVTVSSAKAKPESAKSVGLGVKVQALNSELASQFGVDPEDGILVASVEKNSPASRKGLRQGDIITSVDHQAVTSPKQFNEALKHADLQKGILLNLISNGTARFEILKAN
jgi:S1-C subfamily serine protease